LRVVANVVFENRLPHVEVFVKLVNSLNLFVLDR
jgi:hypothetical protein